MASGGAPCCVPSQAAAAAAPSTSSSPSKASSSAKAKRGSYQSRQRRMGPAPFASFEDLSDELESPDEGKAPRSLLPGIREDSVGAGLGQEETGAGLLAAAVGLQTPSTPRIDISRASSSSQHEESGGSSGGGGGGSPEGRDPLATVAGLAAGFKEEGTAELRSSTEELDYHGSEKETGSTHRRRAAHRGQQPRRKSAERMASPLLHSAGYKYELDAQSDKERKDSACSEGPLLLGVGGRTSRLSSVGSAGSGASGASGMSGLSVASALSGAASSSGMRSPSPHRMLLETSFCGSKPIPTKSMELEDLPPGLESEVNPAAKGKDGGAGAVGHPQEKPATLDLTADAHHSKPPLLADSSGSKEMTSSSSTQSCQSVARQPSNSAGSQQATSSGAKSVSSTPSASPKLSRHSILKKTTEESASPVAEDVQSPSPATSRKSSFTGLFGRRSDSGNLLSPESPTVGSSSVAGSSSKQRGSKGGISAAIGGLRDRSRSRSKSREHIEQTGLSLAQANAALPAAPPGGVTSPSSAEPKTKKDSSRNKGVFSFFKKKDKTKKSKSGSSSGGPSLGDTASEGDPLSPDTLSPDVIDVDGKIIAEAIGNVEFTFNGDGNYQNSEYGMVGPESEAKVGEVNHKGPGKTSVIERMNTTNEEMEDKSFSQKVLSAPIKEEEERELKNGGKQEPVTDLFGETVNAADIHSTEGDHHSSESEREVDYLQSKEKIKDGQQGDPLNEALATEADHERKGLVMQQDSFEDELPYIPTTLPQERSVALPIKPVRQRTLAEIKTCPIERPRSTTPINPSALEDFLVAASSSLKAPSSSSGSSTVEERDRLRISLPREDSTTSSTAPTLPPRARSPRYGTPSTAAVSNWVQFTEEGLNSPREGHRRKQRGSGGTPSTSGNESVTSPASHSSSPPPPLPPRGFQPAPPKQWVNFEEIPEKRKTPKKLHDVSKDGDGVRSKVSHHQRMVYSYVNPEDCKCECHETGRPGTVEVVESGSERCEATGAKARLPAVRPEGTQSVVGDTERQSSDSRKDSVVSVGEVSRLEVDNLGDRHSYQSDSSCELPNNYSVDQQETDMSEGLLKPMRPFGMDLDVSSNRSSIISQDEPVSPENGSPNQKELLHQ